MYQTVWVLDFKQEEIPIIGKITNYSTDDIV